MANPSARRRFEQKVNQIQEQPAIITPSAQFMANATAMVPGNVMGRMGRSYTQQNHQVNAPQTALAAVTLDGERWAFIFPPVVYQFVLSYLIIPANVP